MDFRDYARLGKKHEPSLLITRLTKLTSKYPWSNIRVTGTELLPTAMCGSLISATETAGFASTHILFAICTSTFSKLCINVYSGM
jgi:hypothetical protein